MGHCIRGLIKAHLSCCDDFGKDQNTGDHLAWTMVNRDPMHGVCIPHEIHNTGVKKGSRRLQNHSNRVE